MTPTEPTLPTVRSRRRVSFEIILQAEVVLIVVILFGFVLREAAPDMLEYFIPLAKGCFTCAFNPWYTRWLFFPFGLIPFEVLRPLWAGITVAAFLWASHTLKSNRWVVLLAFPIIAQLWLGQVDAFVVVGLVLALVSPNPYVRGLGLVMASIKPQNAVLPALVLLWHDKDRWRTLIVPGAVFALSLIVWGWWPIEWVNHVITTKPTLDSIPEWNRAAIYPYGLILTPIIALFKEVRERLTAALLISALALPWFGVYAYTILLVFISPWWAVPLSYLWLLGLPLFDQLAIRTAWVLPLALLIHMAYPRVREILAARRGVEPESASLKH